MLMKSGSQLYLARVRAWGVVLLLLGMSLAVPALTAQPIAAWTEPPATNVTAGSSVTFCATAQGVGPFSYQWQKNGINLVNQTNQCLVLSDIGVSDGGSYRATVFNAAGALGSEEGVLMVAVKLLPGADRFAEGQPIAAISNTVHGFSFDASREPGEPRHRNGATSNSVWYVWKAPLTGIVTFNTRGSAFDTVLAVYTGNDLSTLTEVVSDDDSGGFHTSQVSWNAQAGTNYQIVIDGVTGEMGMYVCQWNLEPTPDRVPVFVQQPRSQTVSVGVSAFFEAVVSDVDPYLRYQWFRNGNQITGGTLPRLTLSNVQDVDLGGYVLAVTNSSGRGAVSAIVELEIGPDPSIQSKDKLAEIEAVGNRPGLASLLAGPSAGTFSLAAGTIINQRFFSAGTVDRCEPAHCGVPGGTSRWFELVADSDGICTLDTEGSGVDTVLAVYLQNFSICTNLYEPLVDCNHHAFGPCEDVSAASGSLVRGSRLSFQATAGTAYRAVVDTLGGNRGTIAHFNVHFQAEMPAPIRAIRLGSGADLSLEMRGSSVALQVEPDLIPINSRFQWSLNGRRIAGAATARLLLPWLDFADAGRYGVTLQTATNQISLPGVTVVVVDPCQSEANPSARGSSPMFQLLGATSEPISLKAAEGLEAEVRWEIIGTIVPSREPSLWNVSTGLTRFYRFSRSAP